MKYQIISNPDINETRKKIQIIKNENPEDKIIVRAQDNKYNRKILENPDVNILLSPELHERKDFLKQRDSGLNEFMCRLAKKNNIKIGIEAGNIKKLDKKQKAVVLARIRQNISLCKKTRAKIILFPPIPKHEVTSFIKILGGSTEQAEIKF